MYCLKIFLPISFNPLIKNERIVLYSRLLQHVSLNHLCNNRCPRWSRIRAAIEMGQGRKIPAIRCDSPSPLPNQVQCVPRFPLPARGLLFLHSSVLQHPNRRHYLQQNNALRWFCNDGIMAGPGFPRLVNYLNSKIKSD